MSDDPLGAETVEPQQDLRVRVAQWRRDFAETGKVTPDATPLEAEAVYLIFDLEAELQSLRAERDKATFDLAYFSKLALEHRDELQARAEAAEAQLAEVRALLEEMERGHSAKYAGTVASTNTPGTVVVTRSVAQWASRLRHVLEPKA